ncbi:MAG: glutamate--cysteine ligase [Deltaproteobacteria bacterium]|nr:glutamate--cysteine ligase [Deltaproteobacteria bacterium]
MGQAIDRERFREAEYRRFASKLRDCLAALELLLGRPGFGSGPRTLGCELELFLVDGAGRPLPLNRSVLKETTDPRITHELARFNLEFNLAPVSFAGRPFAAFSDQIASTLAEARRAAEPHGGRVAVIGILPTLNRDDFGPGSMTDLPRYRALGHRIRERRGESFRVRIDGAEPLEVWNDTVTLEGAMTSFQLHLRTDPAEFAALYNAAQLATAPVLSVAGNSPFFLGHLLWEETRVALFRQATEPRPRSPGAGAPRPLPRACFGWQWIDEGALELFRQTVEVFEPMLPILSAERPVVEAREGRVPALAELRIHQGTVWRWNRPVYDPTDGGHLRIELRALPAGPTTVDMMANAAFLLGLTVALAPRVREHTRELPFAEVQRNFYRSAELGLGATLAWPSPEGVRHRKADELVKDLLPLAREGLETSGVEAQERDELLRIVELRAETGRTGANWQKRTALALERRRGREEALLEMLERYMELSAGGEPVHLWPLD